MAVLRNWMSSLYRMLHLDDHQPPWMPRVAEAIDNNEASRLARMFKEAGVQAVEILLMITTDKPSSRQPSASTLRILRTITPA